MIFVTLGTQDKQFKRLLDGVGTIITGLNLHKKMIVADRKQEFKEHVNNHQEQILHTFADDGYILPLEDFDSLQELIEKDFTPKEFKSNNKIFNENLNKEVNDLLSKNK